MSDTTLVEDRLRETYRAVTTRTEYAVAPALALDAMTAPTPVHQRRRPMVALVGIAIVVALVVGVLAFVQRDDASAPRPETPPADTGPIFPPVKTHVGPELYLVPSAVPEGYSLVRGEEGASSISFGSSADRFQFWVKLGADGRPVGAFIAQWEPTQQVSYGPEVPITVNGYAGFWAPDLQAVVWRQDGQTLMVSALHDGSFGEWPEELSRAEVEAVAAGVLPDAAVGYRVSSPPDGYRFAAEAPGTINTGDHARLLVWSDGNGRGFSVHLVDNTDAPPGLALENSLARLVEARGVPAVLTPQLNGADGTGCRPIDSFRCGAVNHRTMPLSSADAGSARYLQWLEPDGTRVTLTAVGMGDDAVFNIAGSLRDASQPEFEQLVATAPIVG